LQRAVPFAVFAPGGHPRTTLGHGKRYWRDSADWWWITDYTSHMWPW